MTQRHFSPALFRFLRELAAHNDRQWFKDNKDRYIREVQQPALDFVVDFGPHLLKISPFFRSDPRPHGGSLHRIYRDIRFSADKSPYKIWAGINFPHVAGKDVHTPGFYLHLQPGASFVGVGLWRPANPTLKLIRDAIVAAPEKWRQAVEGGEFAELYSLSDEALKRPPRGYDPEHPLVEAIKLKSFTALAPLTQKQITAPGFLDEFAALCRAGSPLVRFLCEAIGQDF
jgi:uncharacterized protein (TIGR02453 family)